jgi:hypothetical protein
VADVAAVPATVLTDPYCPWSGAAEPQLRRLQVEFGESVAFTFVIVGSTVASRRPTRTRRRGANIRAHAELSRLALEWRVRPRRVLGGELWEAVA